MSVRRGLTVQVGVWPVRVWAAMTSLTGKTEQTLAGTLDPPPFSAAMFGAVVQLGTLGYVWSHHAGDATKACLVGDPVGCLRAGPLVSDPLGFLILAVQVQTFCFWVISLWGHVEGKGHADPSIVDRLWSILPWLYCWYFVGVGWLRTGGELNPRVLLMACVATVWGLRLTFNFYIKGGFSGGEDYRWAEIRKWFPGAKFEIFNLVFICFFQQNEVMAFALPVAAAYSSNAPLGRLDVVAACLYLALVAGEATADMQMFRYQQEKYRRRAAGEPAGPYARGFIETGLWAYSRHPNYFCEVTMWYVFYLFSVAATGQAANWSLPGCVFLSLLFLPPGASLDVTEALSSRKYKAYGEYQASVSRFVPWFPKKSAIKKRK